MAAGDFSFGNRLLNDNVNFFVETAQPPAAPQNLERDDFARREGGMITYIRYRAHVITVVGTIRSLTSASDCESLKDALFADLYTGEQNLKLGYQDERYWKATLDGEALTWRMHGLMYKYEAHFWAPDSFAYALSPSQDAPGAVLGV